MTFEEFEKKCWEKGYGVAAMNHYVLGGKRFLYCVVFNKKRQSAFQAEAENSEEVFENIFNQITQSEKKDEIFYL